MWTVLFLGAGFLFPATLLLISTEWRSSKMNERDARARSQWLRHQLVQAINEHEETLVRSLAQCRRPDNYGGWIRTRWPQELAQFFSSAVAPRLPADLTSVEADDLRRLLASWAEEIDFEEWTEVVGQPSQHSDGLAYERDVAASLAMLGFSVQYTALTGDQGVDLIAERDGERVVLQCKDYRQPVGNDAVQQVYAGAAFHSIQRAAVIAPHGFTESANELALRLGVALLHHSELYLLAARPSPIRDPRI